MDSPAPSPRPTPADVGLNTLPRCKAKPYSAAFLASAFVPMEFRTLKLTASER
jgi:hypothetical protein